MLGVTSHISPDKVRRLQDQALKPEHHDEHEHDHTHRMLATGDGTYKCSRCGYVYDPEKHDGTAFEDQPETFKCPVCTAPKTKFNAVGGSSDSSQSAGGEKAAAWGTCTYENAFAGGEICMEFVGSTWTGESAKARCDKAMPGTAGVLDEGAACATTSDLGGWCMTAGDTEATPMSLDMSSSMMDTCEELESSCKTWSQGIWQPAGSCVGGGAPGGGGPPMAGADGGRCALAPGPIGGAHQLGFSPGYSTNCAGTPAEGSPYMWPLRWKANVAQKSFKFGSDEVQYESAGRVWYRLDNNWKRSDTWYQKGVMRAVGQAPCDTPDPDSPFGCLREQKNTTMLHRGTKMVFIEYSDDFKTISKCYWLDMSVIGNVRPDWFMDARGDATDVQYIGDSHVYYRDHIKLVKQWRKKDFANQYFTMSMQRLPGEDGVHWPLILNVPGEGFGDDFLQHYWDHELLNESTEDPFLLEQAFEAAGGSCPQMNMGDGASGPPTGQVEHIPSNLEREDVSWRSIVHTESPVWKPPPMPEAAGATGVMQLATGISAEVCWDPQSSMVRVSSTVETEEPVWAAIAFRKDEECLMTPRGGMDGEVVLSQQGADGEYAQHYGPLPAKLKKIGGSSDSAAVDDFMTKLTPLEQVDDFAAGTSSTEFSSGKLTSTFSRAYDSKPSEVHLTYAVGYDKEFGYHRSRGCFDVKLNPCADAACGSPSGSTTKKQAEVTDGAPGQASVGFSVLALTLLAALSI
eukprot:gnl/TRDRNA2_/TRDRNA2_62946_c0_seq1.p1 gnl/TRDRNA2_/TRDRNA2_62946_c0~~gnl/TRDRNA2_/TRDRNA2_62946_c0_seq1.p1  ORF type:complete len:813 (-),score=146.99 gnl/TRDRNA2_/TRDRNA2_62946_c0_seq1:70-2295(-)